LGVHSCWLNGRPGGLEGGVPPSWGLYKGAGPLCRNR